MKNLNLIMENKENIPLIKLLHYYVIRNTYITRYDTAGLVTGCLDKRNL